MHIIDIQRILNSDPYNRAVFEAVRNSFLVGGFIRDLIFSGRKVSDRDYVVSMLPSQAAWIVQKRLGGTVVSFKHGNMARLVLLNGITMDFTRLRGEVANDLISRDFTMNSIAFSYGHGVMDPSGGVKDIRRRIIRTLKRRNIQDDPLRCLRAYRFQSESGWSIDSWTRRIIMGEANRLRRVPHERITNELFKLLRGEYFQRALRGCADDGIIDRIIVNKKAMLGHNIKKMVKDMRFVRKLSSGLLRELKGSTAQGLRNIDVIKLERLTHGWNPEKSRLRLSKLIDGRLRTAHRFIDKFNAIDRKQIDKCAVFDILSVGADIVTDLVVLSGSEEMIELARRFRKITARRLVSAEEIMKQYGIRGKAIGRVLYGIDRERFSGSVRTGRQARTAVLRLAGVDE